jgi:hypothetical protein
MRRKPQPFAVLGTPRSRTAWMARFLTYGGTYCFHEPSANFTSDDSMRKFFKPGYGCADSMLTLKWRELRNAGVRIAVVERPMDEVLDSARVVGLPITAASTRLLSHVVDAVGAIRAEGVATIVPYAMLTDTVLRKMFEVLLGEPCPEWWLERCKSQHVDGAGSFAVRMKQVRANPKLSDFYNCAARTA